MDSKIKPIKLSLKKEYYLVISNEIAKGRQKNTLLAARILRILLSVICKEDKVFNAYYCNIKDLASFLSISPSNIYREIDSIVREMKTAVVYIKANKDIKEIKWFSEFFYEKQRGFVMKLADELKVYLLELKGRYTQYKLKNVCFLNSFYSMRLYEIILSEYGKSESKGGEIEFNLDELRWILGVDDKFRSNSDFIKRVITPSINEIKKKTDCYIFPHFIKNGHRIEKIVFDCHKKRKDEIGLFQLNEINSFDELFEAKERSKKQK